MVQNYVYINSKKYFSGSVFIIKFLGKESEATFIGYNTKCASYFFQINNKICMMKESVFQENFIRATNTANTQIRQPEIKRKKDVEIDGLFLGWVWYIFLMVISVIFNGAIFLWIIISVVFFNWRANKIKEEGTYVEW